MLNSVPATAGVVTTFQNPSMLSVNCCESVLLTESPNVSLPLRASESFSQITMRGSIAVLGIFNILPSWLEAWEDFRNGEGSGISGPNYLYLDHVIPLIRIPKFVVRPGVGCSSTQL